LKRTKQIKDVGQLAHNLLFINSMWAFSLSRPEIAKRWCRGFEISNLEYSVNTCYQFTRVSVQYYIDQAYYDIKRDIQ
jgi:hypothetical protein